MEGCRGCLRILYWGFFGWIHLMATLNARSAGRRCAVPGPEAADLLLRLRGSLLMVTPGCGIRGIVLPSLEEKTLRLPRTSEQLPLTTVQAVSGPDRRGNVVYIETLERLVPFTQQPRLRLIDPAGDRILSSRPGVAAWETAAWDELSLAPVGGKVAFIARLTKVQMEQPPALLETGPIEIWGIESGSGRETGIVALDDGLSWFPDGRRLAYVALVPRDQMPPGSPGPDESGSQLAGWPQVPVVNLLDAETGETEFLHPGRSPVVSTDGRTVLLFYFGSGWRLVDVANRQSRTVRAPGQWGSPPALIDSRLVLYPAFPTAGTRIRLTGSNSPLVGPKLMLTIKVADLETGAFQTVVPYFDARTPISFGTGPLPQVDGKESAPCEG